ncbi:unnamed protein product [Brassica rapa]|uniref:Uncharacterized protein n=1 Tax=Brassica campestris TaxID=3711 RepID=A0A3P5ZVV2_BRACM|nr:unnamed protein product [Brassica rapa]VDC84177.1 unnamed protein product [Brassica rapa]
MANMGGGADPQIPIHPLSSSSLCPLLPLEDNRSSWSSSQIKQNPKRKLEDYLDPALLRTISSTIGRSETKKMEKKDVFVSSIQRTEFDWPVDRLDPLINNPNRDSGREYDGSRFFSPIIPSLNKRGRCER